MSNLKISRRYVHLKPGPLGSPLINPLQNECKLFCSACLVFSGTAWFYYHHPSSGHNCFQNILAYRVVDIRGQTVWAPVRERVNDFTGNYATCYSVKTGDPKLCPYKEDCHFTHSEEEKVLWGLEQEDRFDVSQFIAHYKSRGDKTMPSPPPQQSSLLSLLQKFGGSFKFICRSCFFGRSFISRLDTSKNTCSGQQRHNWPSSKVLAFFKGNMPTLIDKRKFFHQGAHFRMCKYQHDCWLLSQNRQVWSISPFFFVLSKHCLLYDMCFILSPCKIFSLDGLNVPQIIYLLQFWWKVKKKQPSYMKLRYKWKQLYFMGIKAYATLYCAKVLFQCLLLPGLACVV